VFHRVGSGKQQRVVEKGKNFSWFVRLCQGRSGRKPSAALSILQVAVPVVLIASCLLQEPVTDAAMHFRQGHVAAVGPRGKKADASACAGLLVAFVATPA